MLVTLFLVLIALWFLGYVRIDGITIPDIIILTVNGHPITLWNIFILVVVSWLVAILPSPIRQIVGILLIIWILTTLGILSLTGIPLDNILILAIITGIIVALLSPKDVV